MKNILSLVFLILTTFLFSQNVAQIQSKRVAEANYKLQVSNGAYQKALDEMHRSAENSSAGNLNQLNDAFELNSAEKQRFETKLNSLVQKKSTVESKIEQTKSEAQKTELQEKLATINIDLDKLIKKLEQNEIDLKNLQETYRNLNK